MRISQQIVIVYAAVNGYLDDIEPSKIQAFEKELLSIVQMEHSSLLDEIETEKVLNDSIKKSLEKVIKECTALFA